MESLTAITKLALPGTVTKTATEAFSAIAHTLNELLRPKTLDGAVALGLRHTRSKFSVLPCTPRAMALAQQKRLNNAIRWLIINKKMRVENPEEELQRAVDNNDSIMAKLIVGTHSGVSASTAMEKIVDADKASLVVFFAKSESIALRSERAQRAAELGHWETLAAIAPHCLHNVIFGNAVAIAIRDCAGYPKVFPALIDRTKTGELAADLVEVAAQYRRRDGLHLLAYKHGRAFVADVLATSRHWVMIDTILYERDFCVPAEIGIKFALAGRWDAVERVAACLDEEDDTPEETECVSRLLALAAEAKQWEVVEMVLRKRGRRSDAMFHVEDAMEMAVACGHNEIAAELYPMCCAQVIEAIPNIESMNPPCEACYTFAMSDALQREELDEAVLLANYSRGGFKQAMCIRGRMVVLAAKQGNLDYLRSEAACLRHVPAFYANRVLELVPQLREAAYRPCSTDGMTYHAATCCEWDIVLELMERCAWRDTADHVLSAAMDMGRWDIVLKVVPLCRFVDRSKLLKKSRGVGGDAGARSRCSKCCGETDGTGRRRRAAKKKAP